YRPPGSLAGQAAIHFVARHFVEPPVGEHPVALPLHVDEIVTPVEAVQVALDEAAYAVVETDTGIGTAQQAALQVGRYVVVVRPECRLGWPSRASRAGGVRAFQPNGGYRWSASGARTE